jgi:hypothetical protein
MRPLVASALSSQLLFSVVVHFAVSPTAPSNVFALCDLYHATNGPQWKCNTRTTHQANCTQDQTGWMTCDNPKNISDPCHEQWHGIVCKGSNHGDNNRMVTNVQLEDNNLAGYLPDSFAQLEKLDTINLMGNKLVFPQLLPFDPSKMVSECNLGDNSAICVANVQGGSCPDPESSSCLPHISNSTGHRGTDGCGCKGLHEKWIPEKGIREWVCSGKMPYASSSSECVNCTGGTTKQFPNMTKAGCTYSSAEQLRLTCCQCTYSFALFYMPSLTELPSLLLLPGYYRV